MRYSSKLLFLAVSLAVSSCDTENSSGESANPATIEAPDPATIEAPDTANDYTLSSDDRKRLKSILEQMQHHVLACEIEGGLAEEFQSFLEAKGLRSRSIGGDENRKILVHRDDLEHFLEVADSPEIIDRYGLIIRQQE